MNVLMVTSAELRRAAVCRPGRILGRAACVSAAPLELGNFAAGGRRSSKAVSAVGGVCSNYSLLVPVSPAGR